MSTSVGRRIGVILAVVVLLSVVVPAAAASGPVIHVVQRGDTLYAISLRYGVSMAAIAAANSLPNWNHIYVGQRLVIPSGQPQPGRVHVVRWGETLSGIARWYGVDVWALARANGIWNLNRIYVGQRLIIPGR